MYGLLDKNKKPVAFHREKRIIMSYMDSYYETNKEFLTPFKIKRKKLKEYHGYEDLYLVRYGSKYIQSKYLYIHQLDIEPLLDDLICAHDVIIRVIEFTDNKKKCDKLSIALSIIDDKIKKLKKDTPSLQNLRSREIDYMNYQYQSGIYE